jgi:MFS family permease
LTTIISRMYFGRMLRLVGRMRLMIVSLIIGGAAFVLLAVPGPVWLMAVAMTLIGYGMGIATTLALSTIIGLAPPQAQGTAVTLRITGNRVGQLTLPILGGLAASASGAAGIMVCIGFAIIVSGWTVFSSQRKR